MKPTDGRPHALAADSDTIDSTAPEDRAANGSIASWDRLFAALLVVAVFLVYLPAWQGGFLWDDDNHLLNNPVLKPGGLAKAWVPGSYLNYWPVTYSVYWLEFTIWGLEPLGFHLVNIAVHALSALLLWRILVQLRVPGAMFAAALFAMHPVNVESVAWIAQLKGILALVLGLVSVLIFLSYEKLGGGWRWALSIAAFWLSTLAKGTLITLPVVLLACAWWQRGRIQMRDLLRVLPFVLIGAGMAGVEVWSQHRVGTDAVAPSYSLLTRTAVAGGAVWFYLGKLLWPLDLCMFYPAWPVDRRDAMSYLPCLLLALVLGLAWWWRRSAWGRAIVMLIVGYVGLLLPALGFAKFYFMRYSLVADHYQYAAMIVPCAVLAGAAATLLRLWHVPSFWQRLLGLVLLAVLALLAWRQSRMYADPQTLYRTTIEQNPNCWMAYNNLGQILAAGGEVNEAIADYQSAMQIKPDFAEAHINLGLVMAGRGQIDEAIGQYRKALEIDPNSIEARNDLGITLAGRGKFDEALAQFRRALEVNPDCLETRFNLGVTLASRGRFDEAIAEYRKALEIDPDDVQVCYNLGLALAGQGRYDDAIKQYQKVINLLSDQSDKAMAEIVRAEITRCRSAAGAKALPADRP